MVCVKDLKMGQIRKLDGAYYVQLGCCIGNQKPRPATIFYYNKELWLIGIQNFLLCDEDRIFTTKDEAFAYCKQYNIEVNEEVVAVERSE